MRVTGVICEFNPFHHGHAYLLRTLRSQTEADAIVCVMSGNFVQRGGPACIDKWTRARMALSCGADLVLELPVTSATQAAERFAAGGVTLLESLGVVNCIGFGSESGDVGRLLQAAKAMAHPAFRMAISEALQDGVSYPAARQTAMAAIHADASVLDGANDGLAVEYLRVLSRLGSTMVPCAVHRTAAGHDAPAPSGAYASATYLRGLPSRCEAKSYIPEPAYQLYCDSPDVDLVCYETMVLYRLRTVSRDVLQCICDVTEGLENWILSAASCESLDVLRAAIKSKRYTMTRIDRVLLNILLDITKPLAVPPQYVRVLGFGPAGAAVLRKMKQTCSLPVVVKTADASLSGTATAQFQKDVLATDLYSLLDGTKKGGRDFTTPPIVIS